MATDAIYLVHLGSDYSKMIKNIFSAAGELTGFMGGFVGLISEAVSEFAGGKVAQLLSGLNKKKTDFYMARIINDLDKNATSKDWVEKIGIADIVSVKGKNSIIINGPARLQIELATGHKEFLASDNDVIQQIKSELKGLVSCKKISRIRNVIYKQWS